MPSCGNLWTIKPILLWSVPSPCIVLETMDSYEVGKSMKKIIKEGNYKGLSVISEEQVIKAAETLLSESK